MNRTLEEAYTSLPPSPKELRRQRDLAQSFRADSALEKLLAQRENDPLSYASLSPSLHMQVGYYEASKSAAENIVNNAE